MKSLLLFSLMLIGMVGCKSKINSPILKAPLIDSAIPDVYKIVYSSCLERYAVRYTGLRGNPFLKLDSDYHYWKLTWGDNENEFGTEATFTDSEQAKIAIKEHWGQILEDRRRNMLLMHQQRTIEMTDSSIKCHTYQ